MESLSDTRPGEIEGFLKAVGWAEAEQSPLSQDASTRRYVRLTRPDGATAMLMDARGVEDEPCPPGADEPTRRAMGWNALTRLAASRVDAFIALAGELSALGLSAPDILAADTGRGLAVIEDFGAGREFARLIERGEAEETHLYATASEVLAELHRQPAPQ